MGLDTSHDCWHGPYSMFMRFRERLHWLIQSDPRIPWDGQYRKGLREAWVDGVYNGPEPINSLMNHSDCDGEIPANECGPLADALEALLVRMPERGTYDEIRPATLRFIAGLRRAAAAGEPVDFH